MPDWDPDHEWALHCRHLVWGGPEPDDDDVDRPENRQSNTPRKPPLKQRVKGKVRTAYHRHVKRWLSAEASQKLFQLKNRALRRIEGPPPLLYPETLRLSGLVYTSIFNQSDRRKNTPDMLTSFLHAFHDRPDVTLVLKLATNPAREFYELQELRHLHGCLNLDHKCRVVVLTEFLSDEQMAELYRATTFYVNTSRAEGACLPLQRALAAGRPAIAPTHTAMADYMDESIGFPIRSHPELTFWPHDPQGRYDTTWNRLVWSDLVDQFHESAALADTNRSGYQAMSSAARQRMSGYASHDVVETSLRRALQHLSGSTAGDVSWAA